MYLKVWLACPPCRSEFALDVIRLQQQPQRACPNCGQLFDIRGMGLLAAGLEQLNQAAGTVKFRLEGEQRMLEIARVLRAAQAMAVPKQGE